MKLIRNLLALVGLVALLGAAAAYVEVRPIVDKLDPGALKVYSQFGTRFMETLDPGISMVKSIEVKEGLAPEDVVDSLKSLSVQYGMLFVGEAPFYKQVEAVTGKPYRYVAFYSFCDAMVGVQMLEYDTAYTAFMPCRISLVEDGHGRLWLHTMDLDMFIYGGKPLPPDLKAGAIKVRDALDKILHGAAEGEF